MPAFPRLDWTVLAELDAVPGAALWQRLRDVLLWCGAPPEARAGLFRPPSELLRAQLDGALERAPELEGALRALWAVPAAPERAEGARVGEACAEVALWAEALGMKETLARIREWCRDRPDPDLVVEATALSTLAMGLPSAHRVRGRRELAARLAEVYREAGAVVPGWVDREG